MASYVIVAAFVGSHSAVIAVSTGWTELAKIFQQHICSETAPLGGAMDKAAER